VDLGRRDPVSAARGLLAALRKRHKTNGGSLGSTNAARRPTRSRIREGYVKSLKHYAPDVEYRYTLLGSEHTGSTLRFSYVSDWGAEPAARKRIGAFPVGRRIDVHYNPGNPSESILEAGLSEDDQEIL
jgi:hypothetical protein